MTEDEKIQQPTEVKAEVKVKIRIRRLGKIETTGNVASNASGN
ncbi:hypothetical protein [Streptosporangium sp. NPDC004631]